MTKIVYRNISIELEFFPKEQAEKVTEEVLATLHENRFGYKLYAIRRHTIEERVDDDD